MQKIKNLLALGLVCSIFLTGSSFSDLKCEDEVEEIEAVEIDSDEELGIELLKATNRGDLKRVKALLDAGVPVDFRDEHNQTALHFAAYEGHQKMVEFLVSKDANVNAQNKCGCTPLGFAVCGNFYQVVSFLLKKGADISIRDSEREDILECITKDNALDIDWRILALLRFYLLKHYAGAPFRFCRRVVGFSN